MLPLALPGANTSSRGATRRERSPGQRDGPGGGVFNYTYSALAPIADRWPTATLRVRLDRRSTRRTAVTLAVLLLHVALGWLFLSAPGIPPPHDEDTLEVRILPLVRSLATGDSLPQIKPRLRMPIPPIPESALEVPIEVPVEIPIAEEPVSPSIIATPPAPADGAAGDSQAAAGFVLLHSTPPTYPSPSITRGEQGNVLVALTLDDRGQPVGVRVLQSSGFKQLDAAAMRAVRKWRVRLPAGTQGLRQIGVQIGFHLSTRDLGLQASVAQFDADFVRRINASARRNPAPGAPTEEAVRQIIDRVLAADNLELTAAARPAAPQADRFRMTKTDVVAVPLPSAGKPARSMGASLNRSPVHNIRLMGAITRSPAGDFGPAASDRQGTLWYVFAVRQERETSEWLLAVDNGGVTAVEVLAGGPPCSQAPDSPACAAAR